MLSIYIPRANRTVGENIAEGDEGRERSVISWPVRNSRDQREVVPSKHVKIGAQSTHDARLDLIVFQALVIALLSSILLFHPVPESRLKQASVVSACQSVFRHGAAHDSTHQIVWTRSSIYPWQTFAFTVAKGPEAQDPRQYRNSTADSTKAWSALRWDTGAEPCCWTLL